MAKPANDVRLDGTESGWSVYVTENGKTDHRHFGDEAFARSVATGQQLRLGLKTISEGRPTTPFDPDTRQADLDKWLLEEAKRRRAQQVRKPLRGKR